MKKLIDTLQSSRDFTVAVQVDAASADQVWDYKLVGEKNDELKLIHGNVVDGISVDEQVTAGELSDYLSGEVEPETEVKVYSESTGEEYTTLKIYKKQKLVLFCKQ